MLERSNFIGRIRRGHSFSKNPLAIKERVAKFFEDLYSCERFLRPQLDGLAFPAISLESGLQSVA